MLVCIDMHCTNMICDMVYAMAGQMTGLLTQLVYHSWSGQTAKLGGVMFTFRSSHLHCNCTYWLVARSTRWWWHNSCASSHVARAVTAATTVPLPVMAWSRLATNLMIRQGNMTAALLCKVRQNLDVFPWQEASQSVWMLFSCYKPLSNPRTLWGTNLGSNAL